MRNAFFLFATFLAFRTPAPGQMNLDDLGITVTGPSREFAYTNGQSAFLYGETNGEHRSSWQGFNVGGHEVLDGYTLIVNDTRLAPASAISCTVYPDYLLRRYPGGILEEVRPVDSLNLFAILVRSPRPIRVGIIPWFTDAHRGEDMEVELRDETALLARKSVSGQPGSYPRWLALSGPGFLPQQTGTKEKGRYSPALLLSGLGRRHLFVVAAGATQDGAAALARNFRGEAGKRFAARRARMADLLARSATTTSNARFDRALNWAKISLDALIMNQGRKGIFAGLPWFNNYWGRDTFISLPGAVLVTGRFQDAREILRSFADFQERESTSSNYGRIPNFVNPSDRAYNTADGTPRFIMMAREYIERSGDRRFLAEIFPVVVRAIEGTLRNHSDSLGFLTHAGAESWMDAAGPEGAWSPRGNRANDIQALWSMQLEAGIWFATEVGDVEAARSWTAILKKLKQNFPAFFVRGDTTADHLKPDGSADWSFRPNQIFTGPMLDDSTRAAMVHRVTTELTYPYGVASLWQGDERFHPYHQNPPYYPKDAAYHNGTVWTWLQGPVISELCRYGRQETAWKVTSNSVHQILDRGAVGTQSELLDALPRPGAGEPELSGTFSQAWNLAEFVRNWYDDYLGFSLKLLPRTLTLEPNLPDSLGNVEATIPAGDASVRIRITRTGKTETIELLAAKLGFNLAASVRTRTSGGTMANILFLLSDQTPTTVSVRDTAVKVSAGGSRIPFEVSLTQAPVLPARLGTLTLASPHLRDGLRSLQGPDYPILSNNTIKASGASATSLIDASDPSGDDTGVVRGSVFSYPQNPLFVHGSFDLTRLAIGFDSINVFFLLRFKALSDPGWHPEYGFQLTFAAIAIDTDGIAGSGSTVIGHNAGVTLPPDRAFERLILVGGGVRVEDRSGRILAEYFPLPQDASNPLGDASGGAISFAIPRTLLGTPSPYWKLTVLAGAQDDHGGAGVGEFRTVNRERGEWNGGGRLRPEDPNVYDELDVPPRQ